MKRANLIWLGLIAVALLGVASDAHAAGLGSAPATRALSGGALLGLGASLLLFANGRVAGISGMLGGLVVRTRGDVLWRALFLVGLVIAGLGALALEPSSIPSSPRGVFALALAGALVGVGTRMAHGCTSGHGLCGISRLSLRSVVATLTFTAAGVVTVTVLRLYGGGP